MNMSVDCPYGADSCPKVEELERRLEETEESIKEQSTDIKMMMRYLYIIVGMVAVNWGISLW